MNRGPCDTSNEDDTIQSKCSLLRRACGRRAAWLEPPHLVIPYMDVCGDHLVMGLHGERTQCHLHG